MSAVRIMVVEDDATFAKHIGRSLENLGYSVVCTVETGKDAISCAREHRPDLILMDIILKDGMDGIETAAKIREELTIPVVYATAYHTEDMLQRAKITEPFGYILKPFKERELHAVVEIALYKSRMEADRAELTKALKDALDQVKTLTGLLPICSSCKKIRDDKGSWKQLEEYIHARSTARFTHSICPECMKKIMPDIENAHRDSEPRKKK